MLRNHQTGHVRYPRYWEQLDDAGPLRQPGYYGFNIWSRRKIDEKLEYRLLNPVRAGLVERAVEYRWSSAPWYFEGKSSGVTIGRVTDVRFDPELLDAEVTFVIDQRYDKIPEDSDASILTSGLLGSQYIGLQAGGSDLYLEDGSEIQFTQSAIVIENLISKYLFNSSGDSE